MASVLEAAERLAASRTLLLESLLCDFCLVRLPADLLTAAADLPEETVLALACDGCRARAAKRLLLAMPDDGL